MNALTLAFTTMSKHIDTVLAGQKDESVLEKELLAMDKKTLVAMLLKTMKAEKVKVEDVVKPILEDQVCSWLTAEDIATAVAERMNSNTSSKSIASYASKYPKEKGWVVVPRKSTAERTAAFKELLSSMK